MVVREGALADVGSDEEADLVGEGEAWVKSKQKGLTLAYAAERASEVDGHSPQKTANGRRCFVRMKSDPLSQKIKVAEWKTKGSRPMRGCKTFWFFFFMAL